jgi:hypothetical protein
MGECSGSSVANCSIGTANPNSETNSTSRMAEYPLETSYKDPSAVLVGGVLEQHLRKLCTKNGIPTANPTDGKPRKSDVLNADLAKQSVYDKLSVLTLHALVIARPIGQWYGRCSGQSAKNRQRSAGYDKWRMMILFGIPKPHVRMFWMELQDLGFPVGASEGSPTHYIYVEYHTSGAVHGRPISRRVLKEKGAKL